MKASDGAESLGPDEVLVRRGQANRLLPGVAIGGHLLLTDRRLIFQPHRLNFVRGQTQRPLSEIARLERFGLLRFGVAVTFRDGTTEKYRLFRGEQWMRLIETHRPGSSA